MSLPSWVQIWHPQLKTPKPWDPTLMQRFAAERSAHLSTTHSLDASGIPLVPPPPASSPTTTPPPPPPDTFPLPPPPPQSSTEETSGVDLQENDVGNVEFSEPTPQYHTETGHDVGRSSDSGSEMSLSSIEDTPIIHSSDNAGVSLHGPISDDMDIDIQAEFTAMQNLLSLDNPQPQLLSIPTPATDLVPHSTTISDTQTATDALTGYLNFTDLLEDFNDTTWDTMAIPPTPSPLRNVWTASQPQTQEDTTDAPVATNQTPANPSFPTTIPAPAIHTNDVNPQVTASKPDDTTSSILPETSNTTQFPSSLPNTSPFSIDSNIHRQTPNIPERATPFAPTQTAQPTTTPTPRPSDNLPPNPLHNLPPIYQAAWRQANLSLRASLANTEDAAQRRAEQRRDKAYYDGIEAAKPFFKEGAVDCMINGRPIGGPPDREWDGEGVRAAWEEVYRPGYKPEEEGSNEGGN